MLLRLLLFVLGSVSALDFTTQQLGSPFGGEHTGVAYADLNNDNHLDVLISAGRHTFDQSFALINLGPGGSSDTSVRFSSPLRLGDPGGYYQVDTAKLSWLDPTHTAVLLAGGIGERGRTAAVVLDVIVTGCSLDEPDTACDVSWTQIWQDPRPAGDRNGAFAPTLGDGLDPALVIAGQGSLAIFEPADDSWERVFLMTAQDVLPDEDDDINRVAGLAVGYIGTNAGLVVGPRSRGGLGPAPVVAVWKDADSGQYEYDDVFGDKLYSGNRRLSLQVTGLAMGDLNGDGITDIVEANFISPRELDSAHPIPHCYYLIDENGGSTEVGLFDSPDIGRAIDVGQLYDDSELPDIVYGMARNDILLFANLGKGANGNHLGFSPRDELVIDPSCEIRDMEITSLLPCTESIVVAAICDNNSGNYVFTAQTSCAEDDTPAPTSSPTPAPSPSPPEGCLGTGKTCTHGTSCCSTRCQKPNTAITGICAGELRGSTSDKVSLATGQGGAGGPMPMNRRRLQKVKSS